MLMQIAPQRIRITHVVARAAGALRPGASSPQASIKAALANQGYRPATLNDQLLYCSAEMVTGKQFPNTMCLTEAQLKQQAEHTGGTSQSRAVYSNFLCHKQDCSQ
jgi:hypothetical protein